MGVMKPDCVTSPTGKGRSGSTGSISRRSRYSDGRLTVCGHDCCEHWLQLVHCHYTMGEKGLEQGAVDVGVGFLVRYITYERRLIARHSSWRSSCDTRDCG